MSIEDRIKNRKIFSPTVKVCIPRANPEFEIEIERFSPAERDAAIVSSNRFLESLFGIADPKTANAGENNTAFVLAMGDHIKRHVLGWTMLNGGAMEFNKENLDAVFAEISAFEMSELVADFSTALEDDQKKTTPIPPTDSSNSSAGESPTT